MSWVRGPYVHKEPRRWINRERSRKCTKCYGSAGCRSKVVDAIAGTIAIVCRRKECGHAGEIRADQYKERIGCDRCGDVHDFTVRVSHDYQESQKAGEPRYIWWYDRTCAICKLEISALSHRRAARAMEAKATALRAARRARAIERHLPGGRTIT